MNLQIGMFSGHKRMNSELSRPYSGLSPSPGPKINQRNTVVNLPLGKKSGSREMFNVQNLRPVANVSSSAKHGKGSILFQNQPLKVEGELTISSNSKNPSRTNSKNRYNMLSGGSFNKLNETPNRGERKIDNRSYTPNSSRGGYANINFKSNPGAIGSVPGGKKFDMLPNQKAMTKKTKSYYIPKSSRDFMNLSNVSSLNKAKLNDTNNSYKLSDKSKTTSSGFGLNKVNSTPGRSATPDILRMSRSISRDKNLRGNDDKMAVMKKYSLSRSPNNSGMSRLNKKVESNSSMSRTSKSPFDMNMMKQLKDFKNNKSSNPQILTAYAKKVSRTGTSANTVKTPNVGGKLGLRPNMKKVITGNLMSGTNLNNNTNLSTNSTFKSKIDNSNAATNSAITSNVTNNGTNNSNVGNNNTNNIIFNNKKESNSNSTNSVNNIGIIKSNNDEEKEGNSFTRMNLQKEKEHKITDFREITTSPLLRRKPDPGVQEANKAAINQHATTNLSTNNDESLINNAMFEKFNLNKINKVSDKNVNPNPTSSKSLNALNNNVNTNSQQLSEELNNKTQTQNKNIKNIKMIHEYSKVGYSGYGVKKVNQDNYFVFKNFVSNPNHIYMAVCDGHGVLGHEVSGYLRENLPITLSNQLKAKNKNILVHNVNSIIEDVFMETNYKLQTHDNIDTTFSGSTCVSLIYTPEKIISANVGDSRAVLGKFVKGEWVSYDLTRDHKPNEVDESARIRKRGGRIQPFRDEDGEFIGPARVWLKEDEIPGLAMSRSFGDRVAVSVGVVAEPEIFEYKLQEEDKFMIVASDGVWEFIESEECVNIIKEFYLNNDIVGCCEYIYKESSTRWMREEEVIDDITMIIVFFD